MGTTSYDSDENKEDFHIHNRIHMEARLSTYLSAHPNKKYSSKKLFKQMKIKGVDKILYEQTLEEMAQSNYTIHDTPTFRLHKTESGKYIIKSHVF